MEEKDFLWRIDDLVVLLTIFKKITSRFNVVFYFSKSLSIPNG